MAERESRRPGERIFDFLDRTTHLDSRMRVITGGARCDCAYSWLAFSHVTNPLNEKE